MTRSPGWIAVALLAAATPGLRAADSHRAADDFFEREVRPLLIDRCLKCHGPEKANGALRLDSRDALLRGGEGGAVFDPQQPARSRLLAAVRHEGDLQMPPDDRLTERQVAVLAKWLELGAPWPASATQGDKSLAATHWAFQPLGSSPPPTIADGDWPRTPVDSFVLSRLTADGLTPSPPADRRTLIRRVTVDLTGLPPAPAEVEAFLHDDRPEAYEQLVDRLLASPHFGEQQARHWLDVARYADTKGYVYAREERFWVQAWSYRDWVTRSLNADRPYDEFVRLQLAADTLVGPDSPDLAAMGYLTLGRRFLGVTHDIIDDRIDVVTRGLLGLTVTCARCHDHKYDPIPTRDYYALYGVFQNCTERLTVLDPPAEMSEEFRQGLEERQTKLREKLAEYRTATANRVRGRVADYLLAQRELHKYPEEGFDQILAPDDLLPAFVRRWRDELERRAAHGDRLFAAWRKFAAVPAEAFSMQSPQICRELAAAEAETVHPRVARLFADPPMTLDDVARRYGELFAAVQQEWEALPKSETEGPARLPDPDAEELRQVLYGPLAPCEPPHEPIVTSELYFTTSECEELWRLQGEVERWLIRAERPPAAAVSLVDRDLVRNARVLRRGNPAQLGEEVPRQFLERLSGPDRQPFQQGSGRRELAEAIVNPANPLTARAIVNRVWLHHFGAGLVRTPSDFGLRAEPPSHPELLDWLARRFVEEGWSLKWLHRQIVLSATYRQSSAGPADDAQRELVRQRDPGNRLLWRMTPRRLSFEELRDAALAASGRLDDRLYGKPVELFARPYPTRRTTYGLVDRQFLPSTLRMFDFANPDLHTPQRSETTVPQQALFLVNHPLVHEQAEVLADWARSQGRSDAERVTAMFQQLFQRSPTAAQQAAVLGLIDAAERELRERPEPPPSPWQYGYGEFDGDTQRVKGFVRLPYFTGGAWQGGPEWPDAKLGWVQLTATGGHAGNDRQHAAVRRWVAPHEARLQIRSTLKHEREPGDGIRAFLVSSTRGLLGEATLHNAAAELSVEELTVSAGDTLDFVVDIGDGLNNDDFTWEIDVSELAGDVRPAATWNARAQFAGVPTEQLNPWAQAAQVLLMSNEFLFVD